MESLINSLRHYLLEASEDLPADRFRIRGLWSLTINFKPHENERLFIYDVAIAQCLNQGCCYATDRHSWNSALIGLDARTAITNDNITDIAILDAAFASLTLGPHQTVRIQGHAYRKSRRRAALVLAEIFHLFPHCLPSTINVAVIGAIGTIISQLVAARYNVSATDLDPSLVGRTLSGVQIADGKCETIKQVRDADIAIVTGMTIATNTLPEILLAARQGNTKIILIAETGAWFAPFYCNELLIDSVIAEPFPFYIFSGATTFKIFRRQA